MKVFIITEGSIDIGFGHLSRCTSIYQAFEERDIEPCLIVNGDDSISQLLKDRKNLLFNWIIDESKLINYIQGADIVIIDSYLADQSIYRKIANMTKIIAYIDDSNRLEYPLGVLINGNLHANNINYSNRQQMTDLIGPKYMMLKKEFWDIPVKNVKKNIKKILITLGGSDIRNLTPIILELLNQEFPNIIKKVIIGNSFKNIDEIEKIIDDSCELIYSPLSEQMKEEMLDSDIAITAGGQTVYELASVGVPTITIAVVKNQIANVKKCAELGLNYYAGWWEDNNLFNNILKFTNKLKNQEIRTSMIKKGRALIKPDGSREIVRFLIRKFKKMI